MPMWQAMPIAAVVLSFGRGMASGRLEVREDSTLFWATGLLCIALVPPCVSGLEKGAPLMGALDSVTWSPRWAQFREPARYPQVRYPGRAAVALPAATCR